MKPMMKPGMKPIMKHRGGLTLLELLLATSITVMVGAAIVAMLGAVNAGVGSRRDTRSVMVRAGAARARLVAYVAPARCVLAVNGATLTLWLDDTRTSDTVHATEIRWLRLDPTAKTLKVYFVKFPSTWSNTARDLEDLEYPATTDWDNVLNDYKQRGFLAQVPLMDGITSVSIITDQTTVLKARHISLECGFTTEERTMPVSIPATITAHHTPKS